MNQDLYYDTIEAEETPQAQRLAVYLLDEWDFETIADVGCGTGLYLKPFHDAGKIVKGFELSQEAVDRAVAPNVYQWDITQTPIRLHCESPFDLTLCLEVFEHIDAQDMPMALDNLTWTSDMIIFSAAIPGQGGDGHINLQPKDYWRGAFAVFGFYEDEIDTEWLVDSMRQGYHMGWFTQNVMVMRRHVSRGEA